MSKTIEMGGISFISIKEAASLVSYSRDYVARLAREKKIVATQVSRQWFVDPVSLKNFAELSNIEQDLRKRQLSEHRRRGLLVKQEVKNIKSSLKGRVRSGVLRSRVAATFVLLTGLSFGVFGYHEYGVILASVNNSSLDWSIMNDDDHNKYAEIKFSESEVTELLPQAKQVAVYSTVVEKKQYEDSSEVAALKQEDLAGIFLMTQSEDVLDEQAVANMFSDDVEVRFTTETGGVVVYEEVPGQEREFPFVSVPARNASSTVVF